MLPFIEIAGQRFTPYALMWGLAIFVGGTAAFQRMLGRGIPPRMAAVGTLLMVWGGLIGLVILGALPALVEALGSGQPFSLKLGFNIFAFVLGALISWLLYWRKQDVSLWRVADAAFLAAPLAEAVGRWGCLGAGCCGGRVTDSWLALYLPDASGIWAARYPTQMLASLGGLSAALIVVGFEGWRRAAHKPPDWPQPGFVAALTLFFAGLQRFLIEFLRADPALIGPFHLGHLFSGLMILMAVLIVFVRRKSVEQGDLAGMPQLREQRPH